MQPVRFDEKNVLVTGAGSGIGRETAIVFAARGARTYLCDVDEEGLAETARMARGYGNPVRTDRVDVSSRAAMQAYAEAVHREVPAVDVLINNAGVGLGASFLNTTLEDWEWLLGVNLWGVVHGCHLFIPTMVSRRRGGHVVNVASAAGFVAVPELSAYSTSKFAVVGFSEALRAELAPRGIGVSVICPGVVNTPIVHTARMRGDMATDEERSRLAKLYRQRNYGPEKVAAAIVSAVAENKAIVPVTPEAWALYAAKRASPGLVSKLVGKALERLR